MSIHQYMRFLFIGGVVAAVGVACRELAAFLLGDTTVARYSVTVIFAYTVGIVVSFMLNSRYTFRQKHARRDWSSFPRFGAVAIVGMIATWLISLLLRFAVNLEPVFGQLSGTVAFIGAALLASLLTYPLNAKLVFATRYAPPH